MPQLSGTAIQVVDKYCIDKFLVIFCFRQVHLDSVKQWLDTVYNAMYIYRTFGNLETILYALSAIPSDTTKLIEGAIKYYDNLALSILETNINALKQGVESFINSIMFSAGAFVPVKFGRAGEVAGSVSDILGSTTLRDCPSLQKIFEAIDNLAEEASAKLEEALYKINKIKRGLSALGQKRVVSEKWFEDVIEILDYMRGRLASVCTEAGLFGID